MTYEDDFVSDEVVEFKIGKRVFGYKPITAQQENDWLNEYLVQNPDGTVSQDFSQLNKLKLRNLVKVPYSKELIYAKIGVDKEWNELTFEQKYAFIGKLKPAIFNQIISNIKEIDSVDGDALKKS